MDEFDFGRFLGMQSLDVEGEIVFKTKKRRKALSRKVAENRNYPGRKIVIRRSCDKCWKEAKLQIGSDLAWIDGQPVVLPMPVLLVEGVVMMTIQILQG